MEEYRTWGPPGTGKTTWIANEAARLAEKYGSDQISICSLTNSAVREAVNRDIPIDSDNLTTLHARCKRALQAPSPAEAHMKDFADAYPKYADFVPLRRDSGTREEEILASGSTVFDQIQVARQRMIPVSKWRPDMQDLYSVWSRWCIESGLMDYTTWLEVARDMRALPAQTVVFVDEAQDHTPLQLATLRSWDTKYLVLVGDDDQSLYEWSGVVPEEFMKAGIPENHNRVLRQSYRVPSAVHAQAVRILSKISHRYPKEYLPIFAEGSVISSNFSLSDAEEAVMPGVDDGQEHMILTSCSYMLNGIIRNLREAGIPFHNPYRRSNDRWNPLGTEIAIAARSYLADKWTGKVILRWMSIMSDDVFSDKKGLILMCEASLDDAISPEQIRSYLSERTAGSVLSRRPEAMLKLKDRSVKGLWDYYVKAVGKEVKVIIGTIHSVKSGEMECVHIFPDMSQAAYTDMLHNPDRIHRLFYVAMTRARHSVILHDSGNSQYAYPIGRRS